MGEHCRFDSRWCHWNFSLTQSWSHYGPGIGSVTNRNEYQEYLLVGKGGRSVWLTALFYSCTDCIEILVASNFWNPQGLSRPVMGLLYLLFYGSVLTLAQWYLLKVCHKLRWVSKCYVNVTVSFLRIFNNQAFIPCTHTKIRFYLRVLMSVAPPLVTSFLPTRSNNCWTLSNIILNNCRVFVKSVSPLCACVMLLLTPCAHGYATRFEHDVFLSFCCHPVFTVLATRHNTRNIKHYSTESMDSSVSIVTGLRAT